MGRETDRRSFLRDAVKFTGAFTATATGILVPAASFAVVHADHKDQGEDLRERWRVAVEEYKAAHPEMPEVSPLAEPTENIEFVNPEVKAVPEIWHPSWEEAKSVTVPLPILTYHEVPDTNKFATQIGKYMEEGYVPIGIDTLIQILKGEEVILTGKPFVITFDDTLFSQQQNAVPFLKQYKLPAIFCVMPGWGGDGVHHYMENNYLPKLVEAGFDLASHTFHHPKSLPALRLANPGSWEAQIVESKIQLEKLVGGGYVVKGFCYPYGAYDIPTVELVGKTYDVAFSTITGIIQKTTERPLLHRDGKS